NVALTGPDDVNPWPRRPNEFGGYQRDARIGTLQEQALGALTPAAVSRRPGGSTPQAPVIRFHDIFTQCPRPVDTVTPPRFALAVCSPQIARNARTYEITLANGTKIRRTSSDPGRALLTGFVGGPAPQDDWNKLDTPGLHGLSHTAPYFHNNSAATLEEGVDHYIEVFK